MAEQTARTTIKDLKPVPEQSVQQLPAVRSGFETLQTWELMQRQAKALAAASLVPKEYQSNLPNCIIALEMAQRIGASPLQVMQNLYIVHGRPSWSAQFLISCFNSCGRFSSIRYRWSGEKNTDSWGCQAYATELSTNEVIEGPVITIGLAKKEGWYQKNGSKWQTIPQLMLMYRAAAWLVRTHAPEISMGLQTAEEVHDVYDASRGADGVYEVTLGDLRGTESAAPVDPNDGPHDPQASRTAVETVDTETGEVKPADVTATEEPQQRSALPKFDAQSAEAALRKCKTTRALEKLWKEIEADFRDTDRELPFEVQVAYDEMFDALDDAGGKL